MSRSLRGLFLLTLLACICLGVWMPTSSALAAVPAAQRDCNAYCQSIGCYFGFPSGGGCICAC